MASIQPEGEMRLDALTLIRCYPQFLPLKMNDAPKSAAAKDDKKRSL